LYLVNPTVVNQEYGKFPRNGIFLLYYSVFRGVLVSLNNSLCVLKSLDQSSDPLFISLFAIDFIEDEAAEYVQHIADNSVQLELSDP